MPDPILMAQATGLAFAAAAVMLGIYVGWGRRRRNRCRLDRCGVGRGPRCRVLSGLLGAGYSPSLAAG